MINNYEIRKTNILERFLLLFKKPIYLYMGDKKIGYTNYKHMFGRTYMLKEKLNFRSKL